MNEIIRQIEDAQKKNDVPQYKPGDTVRVHAKVIEGGKERIQVFEGVVIATKGSSARASLTVRKVSHGVGVERTFLAHSPRVAKIEVIRRGRVRRAKLYYLRQVVGKKARIREDRREKTIQADARAAAERKAAEEAAAAEAAAGDTEA